MRAKILLGCYRTGDANDPETYVAAITAVLARYPEEVITAVTHPVTGLPSSGKGWLPTIREVSEACAAAHEPIVQNELRLKRIKDQLEARERAERGERLSFDELKAKYGPNWGIGGVLPANEIAAMKAPEKPEFKPLQGDALVEYYRTHNLGGVRKKIEDAA
jgi:hypothetical protein